MLVSNFAAPSIDQSLTTKPVAGGAERSQQSTSATVLVIDDERMNLAILGRLLEQYGFKTIRAITGQDGLEFLTKHKIDLVLLDIVMPDLDGTEVLRRIRTECNEIELPVIMLTASDDRRQVVEMFRAGANDYITKPFDPEVMMARVDIQLRLKSALDAVRVSEERYALAARATNDGLWDWDLVTDSVFYSARWNQIVGLTAEDEHGTPQRWLDRVHPDDRARLSTALERALEGKSSQFDTEFRIGHEEGNFRWVLGRGVLVQNEDGCQRRMAGSMTDITGGKVADVLTGLPNRLLFSERVSRCFEDFSRDPSRRCAVLYLDLDNFKFINDTFGHDAGDRVLMTAARRLESVIRTDDAVAARFGGDEFAVLLEDIDELGIAEQVGERIREKLSEPLLIQGREVLTQVSIGIAIISEEMNSVDDLLRQADIAMYDAKSRGKSRSSVFDQSMKLRSEARFQIETELRQSVIHQEFVMHYQPIVHLASNHFCGFEALVRWQHPKLGLISPADFIPLAEETGIIVPLGDWVLQSTCHQMQKWQTQFPKFSELSVSVNISGRQLSQPNFVEQVLSTLRNYGIAGRQITLELTETTIMKHPELVREMLVSLRDAGIRMAIDDFGTGFSSLASLHQLPLDILKIDQSFVRRMQEDDQREAIVRTILSLAENIGLETVAEGIETVEELEKLIELGSDHGQGFLLSKPLTSDDATALLTSRFAPHAALLSIV